MIRYEPWQDKNDRGPRLTAKLRLRICEAPAFEAPEPAVAEAVAGRQYPWRGLN
jgi:hypothetical protein